MEIIITEYAHTDDGPVWFAKARDANGMTVMRGTLVEVAAYVKAHGG